MKGVLFSKYHAFDNALGGTIQETTEKNFEEIENLIQEKFTYLNIPIITRMDFGHTAPMHTIPIGVRARIENDKIFILENAVI